MPYFVHTPVLLDEAMDALRVGPGGRYCDGTVGGAGHARAILQRSTPDGMVLGLDRDPVALQHAAAALKDFGQRARLHRGNFAEIREIVNDLDLGPLDGVLLDLGVSSHQLDTPERGFSFTAAGPLDMRMDPATAVTAETLIARLSVDELSDILREFGEQRRARRIAQAIKDAYQRGMLCTTRDLADLVTSVVQRGRPVAIHPATRVFQALRIAVNEELAALHSFLESFIAVLRPGGRAVIICFHSLEDRAVKQRFAQLARPCVCPPSLPVCSCGERAAVRLVNKRAIRPSLAEIARNPRARSARLRTAERI